MNENRQERSDRLKQRFDRDRDADDAVNTDSESEGEANGPSDASENGELSTLNDDLSGDDQSGESKASIKDRPSVLMYLPEELHTELDIRFDELNAQYKREHGRPLEKNRDYYPAVVKASLEGKDVKDVLEI
jgi:hypothetical protein